MKVKNATKKYKKKERWSKKVGRIRIIKIRTRIKIRMIRTEQKEGSIRIRIIRTDKK